MVAGQTFPDALTAGAVAGRDNRPILLVNQNVVPLSIGQEVLRLGPHIAQIVGGTASVRNPAVTRLKQLMGTP